VPLLKVYTPEGPKPNLERQKLFKVTKSDKIYSLAALFCTKQEGMTYKTDINNNKLISAKKSNQIKDDEEQSRKFSVLASPHTNTPTHLPNNLSILSPIHKVNK